MVSKRCTGGSTFRENLKITEAQIIWIMYHESRVMSPYQFTGHTRKGAGNRSESRSDNVKLRTGTKQLLRTCIL